jgi:hypothetical protein
MNFFIKQKFTNTPGCIDFNLMCIFTDVETELGGVKQWLNDAEERLGPGVTECRNPLGKETLPPGTPFVLRRDAKMLEHKVGHLNLYCSIL